MSPGNPFILGSKCQRSRLRVTKTMPAWVFALFWVLASFSSYFCRRWNIFAHWWNAFCLLWLDNGVLCFQVGLQSTLRFSRCCVTDRPTHCHCATDCSVNFI